MEFSGTSGAGASSVGGSGTGFTFAGGNEVTVRKGVVYQRSERLSGPEAKHFGIQYPALVAPVGAVWDGNVRRMIEPGGWYLGMVGRSVRAVRAPENGAPCGPYYAALLVLYRPAAGAEVTLLAAMPGEREAPVRGCSQCKRIISDCERGIETTYGLMCGRCMGVAEPRAELEAGERAWREGR